jgi:hypothetical protein
VTIQTILKLSALAAVLAIVPSVSSAMGFHVSVQGVDANDGSVSKLLQTISAAGLAQPGDTGNLLHDNDEAHELFVEVNHGPYFVDNNIFLSSKFLRNWSQGGAFVHNLMTGTIDLRPELRRETPYHKPHSTKLAGLKNIPAGDDRLLNNIFPPDTGVTDYLGTALPNQITPHFPALQSSPTFVALRAMKVKRPRPAGRSGPTAVSGAYRKKQFPSSGSKRTDGVLKELIGTGSRSSASDAIQCVS